jgi:hypothetical protein
MYSLINKTRKMENLYSWTRYVKLRVNTNLIDSTEASKVNVLRLLMCSNVFEFSSLHHKYRGYFEKTAYQQHSKFSAPGN